MKKAVSLIELIFSIVVIGICLSAIPKIVEVSLQNTTLAFRQEYTYELKSLYGTIRNLPLSDNNFCQNEYSSNSLLSQYCLDLPEEELYKNEAAKNQGINTRFKDMRDKGSSTSSIKPTNINSLLDTDLKALIEAGEIKDVLGRKIKYEIKNDSSVKLEPLTNNNISINIPGITLESVVVYNLGLYKGSEKIVNFNIPFTKLGRLDNIYNRIDLEDK